MTIMKFQEPNSKFQTNSKNQIPNSKQSDKKFDLDTRTFVFAKNVLNTCKKIPSDPANWELVKQLIRSSASVGANYIEANEALSKKDFVHRIRICRKEAKETNYWLKLIIATNHDLNGTCNELIGESMELVKIFSSIANK